MSLILELLKWPGFCLVTKPVVDIMHSEFLGETTKHFIRFMKRKTAAGDANCWRRFWEHINIAARSCGELSIRMFETEASFM